MQVLTFFAWLGVSALVSWLTAFQMPDGYGNAIFFVQFVGAFVSAGFMAMGLPTAIDPTTKVVVTNRLGNNIETTWPREKGVRYAIIGGVVFVVANVGGYVLDRALGLPDRYRSKVADSVRHWTRDPQPALDACLATVWTRELETCKAQYRVTTSGGHAHSTLRRVTCPTTALSACVQRALATGTIDVDRRQLDSLDYAGAIDVDVELMLLGRGPPPPAERPE
jgi:hypothetical protein